jgi:phage-related protein
MWSVGYVNKSAQREVESLPEDMQAHFGRIVSLIQMQGLERTKEPYVKHLDGSLWEMRLKGKSGIARALYVTAIGRRIIILRTFIKKTEKTPRHEMKIALKRSKEIV